MSETLLNYWITKYYNATNNLFTRDQKCSKQNDQLKLTYSSSVPTILNVQEPDINQMSRYNFLHISSAEKIMFLKHKPLNGLINLIIT